MSQEEFHHSRKLVRQVDVVIFRKINKVAFFLFEQDVDLFAKRCLIPYSGKGKKYEILSVKVFSKKPRVLLRTVIEQHP